MTLLIDGQNGPFSLEQAGGYGRNASHNLDLLEQEYLIALEEGQLDLFQQLQQMTIRYSPVENLTFHDALAYSLSEIRRFDHKTQDDVLDLAEISAMFAGNVEIANRYLMTLDRNGDGKVDVVEYAAFVLFSDNAVTLVTETLNALSETERNTLFASYDQETLSTFSSLLKQGYTSMQDGEITATDRLIADLAVINMPTITGMILNGIISSLALRERYHQFKQSA